jgi:hypothetical protein|tara:strand:- start:358 stop:537 length:180 start_codon:yes stop_codon:yes gene_type:complete
MKIKFIVDGLEIAGFGIATKGKEIEVPDVVGNSLVSEGIAKESKASKIKKEEPKEGEGE